MRSIVVFVISLTSIVADAGTLSPELEVDDRVIGPEAYFQGGPAAAFDGTNHLVVWASDPDNDGTVVIRGRRVSTSGTPVDSAGIDIGGPIDAAPAVASDGTQFLVVWSRNGDVFGQRVAGDGTLVGSEITISNASGSQYSPAIAWDGTNFLVVWTDSRLGSYSIYGARVSSAGSVLDAAGLAVATTAGAKDYPSIAFNGTNHLVAYAAYNAMTAQWSVRATRVTPAGGVLDSAGIVVAASTSDYTFPRVASDGDAYFVVWHSSAANSNIYGARVSAAGSLVDTSPIAVAATTAAESFPSIAFDGTTYVVAWDRGDIYGARVTSMGTVLDSGAGAFVIATGADLPARIVRGADALAVWVDGADIYATRVTAGAALDTPPLLISVGVNAQQGAVSAFNGTHHLVAWTDYRDGTPRIRAARIATDGTTQDPVSIAVAPRADLSPLAVASNGNGWLVVWTENSVVYGARISAAGALLGTFTISNKIDQPHVQRDPAVAFDGANYLVAWTDTRNPSSLAPTRTFDVYGARVGPTGSIVQSAIAIAPSGSSEATTPAIACDGTTCFVAWHDQGSAVRVVGGRISAAGMRLDGFGILVSTDTPAYVAPTVSFGGGGYLVAWQDTRNGGSDLYGALVTTAASVGANFAISADASTQSVADSAFDGTHHVIVWRDSLDATRAAFVTPAGVASPSDGLVVSPGGATGAPAVSTASGASMFSYDRADGVRRIKLRVLAPNTAPTATPQSKTVAEDGSIAITLAGSDADGDAISYAISTPPDHGTVTGTAPNVVYTPEDDYAGPDAFTFSVSDGLLAATATVTLTVTAVNDPPVAVTTALATSEDQPASFTLQGSDPDGDMLTFTIATQPADGTLTGTAPNLTFTPDAGVSGADSFTFTVSDGLATSPAGTVSITINPVDDPPTAIAGSATLDEDIAKAIMLSGSDPEGAGLMFAIATGPSSGTLSGTPPGLTYTPVANYHGTDSFTFTVSDGTTTSAAATFTLQISSIADLPIASAQSIALTEDVATAVVLQGSDGDGDTLTFAITTNPTRGVLSGTPPNLTYTPDPNQTGADAFAFTASDGSATSAPATVSLDIAAVDDIPAAAPATITLDEDSYVAITLVATDVETSVLAYTVVNPPQRGVLSGTAPNLTYTPDPDAFGADSFTFIANDGNADSPPATITLAIANIPDAPVALPQALSATEDQPIAIVLTGTDLDGDTLTPSLVAQATHGTLSGIAPNLIYAPATDFSGSDSFSFTMSDGTTASPPAEVTITIAAVNDPPIATAQSVQTTAGTSIDITLTASDVESVDLTFTIASPPAHGTITGKPPILTYTPEPGFTGGDTFSFDVSDGVTTASAAITIEVIGDDPGGCGCATNAEPPSLVIVLIVVGAIVRRRRTLTGIAAAAAK